MTTTTRTTTTTTPITPLAATTVSTVEDDSECRGWKVTAEDPALCALARLSRNEHEGFVPRGYRDTATFPISNAYSKKNIYNKVQFVVPKDKDVIVLRSIKCTGEKPKNVVYEKSLCAECGLVADGVRDLKVDIRRKRSMGDVTSGFRVNVGRLALMDTETVVQMFQMERKEKKRVYMTSSKRSKTMNEKAKEEAKTLTVAPGGKVVKATTATTTSASGEKTPAAEEAPKTTKPPPAKKARTQDTKAVTAATATTTTTTTTATTKKPTRSVAPKKRTPPAATTTTTSKKTPKVVAPKKTAAPKQKAPPASSSTTGAKKSTRSSRKK